MSKDTLESIILFVVGVITGLLLLITIALINEREKRAEVPCEELIKQNTAKEYTPIPKRCKEEKQMKKRTFCARPLVEVTYVLKYLARDGVRHEIINKDYAEIQRAARYLKEKGAEDVDILARLPKKEGSDMFPVNN